eukprot:gene9492-12820_t
MDISVHHWLLSLQFSHVGIEASGAVSFLFFTFEFLLHTLVASRLRYLLGLGSAIATIDDDGNSNANTQDRSFNLVPKIAPSVWIRKAMFAPCIGFAVLHEEKQLMQKLQACGECHDWAVVSLYILSYNNIFIMVLQEPSTYNPNLYVLVDSIHLVCTIVDVLNLSEEKMTAQNR